MLRFAFIRKRRHIGAYYIVIYIVTAQGIRAAVSENKRTCTCPVKKRVYRVKLVCFVVYLRTEKVKQKHCGGVARFVFYVKLGYKIFFGNAVKRGIVRKLVCNQKHRSCRRGAAAPYAVFKGGRAAFRLLCNRYFIRLYLGGFVYVVF